MLGIGKYLQNSESLSINSIEVYTYASNLLVTGSNLGLDPFELRKDI